MPDSHLLRLETLASDLAPWRESFPEGIDSLASLSREFRTRLHRFRNEEKRLSIGIMGQVKAGKSSFVNALLFDGLPVLPEAATPKTANLTAISWGETPLLELEYYTEEEWQALEREAASQGSHPEARMAGEIMGMVKASGLNPMEKIRVSKESIPFGGPEDLVSVLNDYAGENGRYTPVIKMIRIQLPSEALKGLEIVDTPGMNDPVLSRTEKTREYMARCDVVFFLSRAGQFLDSSDTDLLARQLPGRGVKRMVLVACQYDASLLEDGFNRKSLGECERNLNIRFCRRAEEEMEKLARHYDQMGREPLACLIRTLKTPVLASTFAHGFASWPQEKWGRTMNHIHNELKELAEEEWKSRFTQEDWQRISGFDLLLAHYGKAREEKEDILRQQELGMIPESLEELRQRMDILGDRVRQRLDFLDRKELTAIGEERKACEERIRAIVLVLGEIMGESITRIEKARTEILADTQEAMNAFSKLSTRTGTESYTSYRTVSTSTWYKPWTWGDTTEVASTRTSSYQYVLASDAVENVIRYGNESAAGIQREFLRVFDPMQLKVALRKALLQEMDTRSTDFNPGWFRSVIEQAIRELRIPALRMDFGDGAEAIARQFQGEIRSDKMDSLHLVMNKALYGVFTRIRDVFEPAVREVCTQLESVRRNLGDTLTENFHEELKKVEAAFADKEREMASYKKLLTRLEEEGKKNL